MKPVRLNRVLVTVVLFAPSIAYGQRAAIGPDATWKPSQQVLEKIQNRCSPVEATKLTECVASIMRQSGAGTKAIEFTRLLKGEGFMDSFREMGRVDLATVLYPFRANTNLVFVLANGTPLILGTDLTGDYQEHTNYIDERKRVNIKTHPLFASLYTKFPKVELELARNEFESMRPAGKQGGQEFVFSYPLINGCRACEVVGYAQVGFAFNGQGNFTGTRLIRLTSGAGKTVATTAPPVQGALVKRITFPRGRTTVILNGSITGDRMNQYLLGARAGQKMTVHITSPGKKARFDLYLRDDRSLLANSGAEDTTDWEGQLPSSGDYVISVYAGGNARYTLEVTIR